MSNTKTLRDVSPPAHVTTALGAPRVPAIEEWRDEPTKPGNGAASPVMRIIRAEASCASTESAGLADIAEAYALLDANGKVLLRELAKRLHS